ncbi:MAG: hypothetical protein CXT72_04150 [Methanobacteriota archaeon]|nr:MAG: hypothetical protein CXT72_04150 [Euryarchaeota archaeon]
MSRLSAREHDAYVIEGYHRGLVMVDVRYLLLLIGAGIAGQTINPFLDDFHPLYNVALGWVFVFLICWNAYSRFGSDEEE